MSSEQAKKNILICDDERGVRESLNLILSDNYNLTFATNGIEAFELIENNDYNAVLLDIKMPKLHGIEVLTQIKKMRPSLPVIIVTGYQSAEIAKEAVNQGASNYIPKPFESDQILKAVEEAVSD